MKIKRAKGEFDADEKTPLRMGEMAQYFHCSDWLIRQDLKRGYAFLYGKTTTPAHYRAWLEKNPKPRQAGADGRMAKELEGIR